jgi:hypothetical protein
MLGFSEVHLANTAVRAREANGGVRTKRRFRGSHARREESFLASRSNGCTYGDIRILINGIHAGDFEALVNVGVLDNAERIYPEELKPEFSGGHYGVSERGWEK